MLQMGYRQMRLCETNYLGGGVSHQFGELLTSLKKDHATMGYRSDSIALSRDMGPLSSGRRPETDSLPGTQTRNTIARCCFEAHSLRKFQAVTRQF